MSQLLKRLVPLAAEKTALRLEDRIRVPRLRALDANFVRADRNIIYRERRACITVVNCLIIKALLCEKKGLKSLIV
jgi:hypothetical protein